MIKDVLVILLGEFYDKLGRLEDLVHREAQFPKAENKIKVAMGMRRVGKTYFLFQHILSLLEEGVSQEAILYINFEDDRLLPTNEQKLAHLVEAFYSLYPENHDRKCYLFFDEIQNVSQWPIVVRRLHDTKQAEIFLTGTSAKLLSKEIATSLRGRSLAIEIWPYSFQEFLRAKKVTVEKKLFDKKTRDRLTKHFHDYLLEGGFPETITYDPDAKQRTLQEYLDVAIYRDIVERHHIKNPTIVKYMILSMIHNVGKPFAVNKFYNDLRTQGYQIGKDQLYEYADHIEDSYLAFPISLFSKSVRKVQTNPKKLYAIDPGMVRATTLEFENDLGRLFENIIYLELRRLGCHVSYYVTQEKYEVDFVAQTPRGHRKLFQVAWDIESSATYEREKRALQAGIEELQIEGELVTLETYLREGIRI